MCACVHGVSPRLALLNPATLKKEMKATKQMLAGEDSYVRQGGGVRAQAAWQQCVLTPAVCVPCVCAGGRWVAVVAVLQLVNGWGADRHRYVDRVGCRTVRARSNEEWCGGIVAMHEHPPTNRTVHTAHARRAK